MDGDGRGCSGLGSGRAPLSRVDEAVLEEAFHAPGVVLEALESLPEVLIQGHEVLADLTVSPPLVGLLRRSLPFISAIMLPLSFSYFLKLFNSDFGSSTACFCLLNHLPPLRQRPPAPRPGRGDLRESLPQFLAPSPFVGQAFPAAGVCHLLHTQGRKC